MEGNTYAELPFAGIWSIVDLVNDPKEVQMSARPAPVLVPVSALYVRLVSLTAARVAACPACAAIMPFRYCLSHVCLDCGRMAHPHGFGC